MNNTIKDERQAQLKPERIPRAAAAAILSSAFSAFVLTGVFGADMEIVPILSVMLLCAVFTAVIELITLPNTVLLSGAALSAMLGGALLFIPFGGSSIYSMLSRGSDLPVLIALPMVLLFCNALCLAVCILNRNFIMRCIIAGGLLTMLIVFIWFRITLLTAPAALITAYILITVCQTCASRFSLADAPKNMWFVIFSVALAVLIFALPHPKNRIQWEKIFYISSSEQLEQLGNALDIDQISDDTTSSESGYSEDQSNLGGWVDITEKNCLFISYSDAPHNDRLVGGIYDSYTGKGWKYSIEVGYNGYCSADAASAPELSYASGSDIVYVSHSDVSGSAHIKNIYAVSESDAPHKTVFYPPYSYIVVSDNTGEAAVRDGTLMTFTHSLADTYMAYYYKQPCESTITDTELEAYLALPDTIPERVKELAATSTEGCTTDKDKAYALLYTLSGYAYETRISHPPKNHDLVDYFLFDTNKGYCAYHASAMAVLARCVGIPSRYVQGYCINSEVELEAMASSGNAHAWAELYIDGRWIIYDSVTAPIESALPDLEEDEAKENSALRKILLYAYAITAAAAVIFIILKPLFARIPWRIRMKRKHGNNSGYKTILRSGKLLWILSACGFNRTDDETLAEFGKRVCTECQWLDRRTGEKLCDMLEEAGRYLYSANPTSARSSENSKLIGTVRRAYIRKFGIAKYLRGYRRASL